MPGDDCIFGSLASYAPPNYSSMLRCVAAPAASDMDSDMEYVECCQMEYNSSEYDRGFCNDEEDDVEDSEMCEKEEEYDMKP